MRLEKQYISYAILQSKFMNTVNPTTEVLLLLFKQGLLFSVTLFILLCIHDIFLQ